MHILITGGTGFLGRHLVWRAAAEGVHVLFTGRNAAAAAEVQRLSPRAVHWLPLDHGMPGAAERLQAAMRGVDVAVHCAALSSPWGRPEAFQQANVASTREVLHACHAAGVQRLLHVSTPSLYFGFRDQLNIREDAPLPPPANGYVRSKAQAEALVRAAPLPETVIVRPRALFGPHDQTLLPRLLRVMNSGPVPLMRGENIELDLTCIDNAVDAFWRAVTQPLPRPLCVYNLSNGEPRRLGDVLRAMAQAFGLPLRTRRVPWPLVSLLARGLEAKARLLNGPEPALTRYSAGVLAFSQTLDITAIRDELGYRPSVSIEDGLLQHARWWRGQGGQ